MSDQLLNLDVVQDFIKNIVGKNKKTFGKFITIKEASDFAERFKEDDPVLWFDFSCKKQFQKPKAYAAFVTLARLCICEYEFIGDDLCSITQIEEASEQWVKELTTIYGEQYIDALKMLAQHENGSYYYGLSVSSYMDGDVDLNYSEKVQKHTLEIAEETLEELEKTKRG